MEITRRRKMLNRIKKRTDVVFLHERKQGRGIGDVWEKVRILLDVESKKLDAEDKENEQK